MTEWRLNQILVDMNQISPRPQVHIVVLGDNNFRNLTYDPVEVLEWLHNFMIEARQIPKSRVLVCSLIPSIENYQNCDETFRQWDKSLLTILDPEFEIINLQKCFRTSKLEIKESLYSPDGVHLSHSGADLLAKKIFDSIRRLPINFFE